LQILNPPPPLYSDDVHGKPVPAVDWEVEGLAIRGKINLIYGASTAMKSWLAMSLGLHLAAGKPWLGRFNIPEARHVVYVDEEMGEDMMQRRLIQLTSGANLPKNDRRFVSFSYTGLRGNEGSVEMFLQYLKQLEIDPDVIIIDSLIRVIDGDENSNTDAAAFWRAMRRLSGGKRTILGFLPRMCEILLQAASTRSHSLGEAWTPMAPPVGRTSSTCPSVWPARFYNYLNH
jgi:hypothetical protein